MVETDRKICDYCNTDKILAERGVYYAHSLIECIEILKKKIKDMEYVHLVYVYDKWNNMMIAGVFATDPDRDWIKMLEDKFGKISVSLEKIQLNWKRFAD